MLLAHSTGQSLANVPRQQCRNQTLATANQAPLTVTYSRCNTADAAVTRAPAQTATTACTAAAVAASMLLGCCLQPSAALALPRQQLEDIRQAIERDFSDGVFTAQRRACVYLACPCCLSLRTFFAAAAAAAPQSGASSMTLQQAHPSY